MIFYSTVITRCQEAMKLLDESTLTGRFFPKILAQTSEAEKRIEKTTTNQSPLRKVAVVRFNFTTPVNKRVHSKLMSHPSAGVYLHKVLCTLGVTKKQDHPVVQKSETSTPVAAPVPQPVPPPVPVIKKTNMASQTDHWKCQICEIRKARKYENESTQTIEKSTFDVGTQVSVEDLNKSCATFTPRGILKNSSASVQSISHLTPAQLLAQIQREKDFGRNNYGDHPQSQNNPRSLPAGDRFNDMLRSVSHDNYGGEDRFNSNFTGPDNNRSSFMGPDNNRGNFSGPDLNRCNFGNPDNNREFMHQNRGQNFGNNPNDNRGFGPNRPNFSNNPSFENRDEFMNRGPNFGPSGNDPRNFDNNFNANRRFGDMNPNFGNQNWNNSAGRGINRVMGPGQMSNNRFF